MRKHIIPPLALAVLVLVGLWNGGIATADHGTVIESDSFDDPATGIMPRASDDPRLRLGYVAGEYQIAIVDPSYDRLATVANSTARADVALAISVRFVDEVRQRYAVLACRTSNAGHYRLSVYPEDGSFTLARWNGAREQRLAGGLSSAIRLGLESNRVELSCTGATIEAIINGVTVASVRDSGLSTGGMFFGAGKLAGAALTLDARFDRYVLTRPSTAPSPSPTATPTPPPPGSQVVAGVVVIEGQPAPAGTTVRALVGEQECGSARTTQAGSYRVAVLPESAVAGCGRAGAAVRLTVTPRFGSGWRDLGAFPFQAGVATARDITIELRALVGDADNVPWTAAWWGDPTGMRLGICQRLSASSARAVLAGHQQWVDAYYDLGFVLEIIYDDDGACRSDLPGIMFYEEDLDDDDTIAGTISLISPNESCRRTVPCWSAKAMIVINPGPFAQIEPQEQANIIAHEIGHALGLAHARACTGGTIMWADTACRYPMTHIGVDDVASANAKFAVVGFGAAPPTPAAGWVAGAEMWAELTTVNVRAHLPELLERRPRR